MEDRVGAHVGDYRLQRLLKDNGISALYLGEHVRLGTQAAVKLYRYQLGYKLVPLFLQEERALADLLHPNLIRVFEVGVEPARQNTWHPFRIRAYLSHGSLRQRHPKGIRLPLATIQSYLTQVAAALQVVHDAGLLHQEVRQEQLLVGEQGEIVLSDCSSRALYAPTDPSFLVQGETYKGHPVYSSPERFEGVPVPASDQYSLAVIVYEWLSGRPPFSSPSPVEIAIDHRQTRPPSLRELVPALAPAVEEVVFTALAKDPRERFASVTAFARALEQVR